MTTLNKILIFIIGVITFSAIAFIAYQQYNFDKKMVVMQASLIETKQLADNIIRAQSKYVNQAGFDSFVKENKIKLDAIEKDVQEIGGKINAVNVVNLQSKPQTASNIPSTTVTNPSVIVEAPKVSCNGIELDCIKDQYEYFSKVQNLKLSEDFGDVKVPVGEVSFFAGTIDNKPWSYKILSRQYKIANTIAHTEDGRTIVYNAISLKAGDQDYSIPITSSETVEKYPNAEFKYFNPKAAIGISGSANVSFNSVNPVKAEFTPSLNLSIMSYGKSTVNPDIKVLSIGGGYNIVAAKPSVEVSPIQLNIGKAVSGTLLNNTYIGPTVGFNTDKTTYLGVGIQVGL